MNNQNVTIDLTSRQADLVLAALATSNHALFKQVSEAADLGMTQQDITAIQEEMRELSCIDGLIIRAFNLP